MDGKSNRFSGYVLFGDLGFPSLNRNEFTDARGEHPTDHRR